MAVKVIDGSNCPLGRLASTVAKLLLNGEEIAIVNAKNIVISGSRKMILRERIEEREIGTHRKGPFHPKKPADMTKRVVRGMLPSKARGRGALKRLRVYDNVPDRYEGEEFMAVDIKKGNIGKYLTLGDLNG